MTTRLQGISDPPGVSGMDVPLPKRRRTRRAIVTAVVATGVIASVFWGLYRAEKAAPAVDASSLWIDTVRRGPLVRQAAARGVLSPDSSLWVPAANAGRVERVLVQAGTPVSRDTVLMELSNPELTLLAEQAEAELQAAEAETLQLSVRLESDALAQQAAVAAARADASEARLEYATRQALAEDRLVSSLDLELARVRRDELEEREQIENRRLEILDRSADAQRTVQHARIRRLRATWERRVAELSALAVRAGVGGVLQRVEVEVGQRVDSGQNLARVADPSRLKAILDVDPLRAGDVQPGQTVTMDVLGVEVPGVVTRVDPAVEGGAVSIDVALSGELPRGARPDLRVQGRVELDHVADALSVGAPSFGREHTTIDLFRIDPARREAVRVAVRLGRDSVQRIEVVEGLKEGEQVVLSDMSRWNEFDRIRLR